VHLSWTDLIGSAAGTLTTIAFIPQVVKAWRTRSVEDLSSAMLLTFSTGVALWIVYGVGTRALPVVAANAITLVMAMLLVGMKLGWTGEPARHEKRPGAAGVARDDAVHGVSEDRPD
jgi:MtN3 and saliva related transmembrane protein